MARKIFVNYRRSSTAKDAQLLERALQRAFGAKRVFLDRTGIDGGDHWMHTLEQQVHASAAMVVLIGEGWADVRNEKNGRRLEDPNDFVRFEIARALAQGIPALPVLIDGAAMPTMTQLPEILAPLTFVHAMRLRTEYFDDDAEKIVQRLRYLIAQKRPRGVPIWQLGVVGALALAAGVLAGPPIQLG